ncbi:MAG: BCCT family transporter [Bacteroidetes bacterium]|nr:BCCT family transporter [Bacteroidota bacterium]
MKKNKLFSFHKPVFIPSAILIFLFITVTLWVGEPMADIFESITTAITQNAGWFLIIAVNVFVVSALLLAFSKFGNIRLGGAKATPDFTTFSWFSMLFSAGMGIGLLFFGVAEPIMHYHESPVVENETIEAAETAMQFTYLHYGLHAWGIYAMVGLSLAFFCFNRKLPLTIRSVFYPLMGDRIYNWQGNLIDVVAVAATLFGLATSLGLGVQQISSGLNYLLQWPDSLTMQVALISGITAIATISVVMGLDKGVRFLSVLNMRLGLVFLLLLLIVGPTVFIFNLFVESTGSYVQNLVQLSTWSDSFTDSLWQDNWTVFYWAWWISWSPFVGMFIARVSKGRTVKEFILGVLLVPSILTFFWFAVFGGSALFLDINGLADISTAVGENISTALFVMLEEYPVSEITAVIGIILVTSFFVTSSDSGSLVIDSITAGGKLDAPVGQRIFWAVMEGAVAATLLIGGGLKALQTAAISTGLPFTILLLIMVYSLWRGLRREYREKIDLEKEKTRQEYADRIEEILNEQSSKKEKSENI